MVLGRCRRTLKYLCVIGVAVLIVSFSNWLIILSTGFHIAVVPLSDLIQAVLAHPVTTTGTSAQPQILGQHKYLPNGLLLVNENGPHPIYELMERAEEEWNNKLKQASKTLEEAVKEYRRRYRRYPPKGFDLWWKYVTEHNVQLPDEYDTIYHDLEPFWGLQPTELLKTRDDLESKIDSYTVGKDANGHIGVVNYAFREGTYNQLIQGSKAIINLLSDIEDHLPQFRAVFSPHDGPNRLSDYFVRSTALRTAHDGAYVAGADMPEIIRLGWRSACSPSSPARRKQFDLDSPPPRPEKKTFIHNHVLSMDPCLHPDHLHHHGQFLSHNEGPTPQHTMVPEFSYCSTTIHHNIRIPTPYGWVEDIKPRSHDPDWDDKQDERLLWRGRNTGMFHDKKTRWQGSHRDFLVQYANDLNGTLSILRSTRNRTEQVGVPQEYRKSRLNPAIMDITFADKPIACSPATCELLSEIYPWRERQSIKQAGNYKYIIDVDGNGWSGRFKRLVTTNSLIFKTTIYPEWYSDRVAPWLHYVPIQVDLSDLHDTLVFFRGDANGEGAHDESARKIAVAGRQWSKRFWRREDMIAYFYR
ncbi:hypothetical protein AX15_000731 [Amanita polypyramis BW_CC]|nr:hypothetical protein AX15_000731 [Amanita polypyramis BW_CC]